MTAWSLRHPTMTIGLAVAALGLAAMESQAQVSKESANPACALLSVEDVRKITGYADYTISPGDPSGQGVGGGSSCQYSAPTFAVDAKGKPFTPKGPLVSVVLIDGRNHTRTAKPRSGCTRESVSGIGDEAYFEACAAMKGIRTPALYVKAGAKDLIVQMDIDRTERETPNIEATMRSKVIALAKAAAAKAR